MTITGACIFVVVGGLLPQFCGRTAPGMIFEAVAQRGLQP
jgi:hypothetical protein